VGCFAQLGPLHHSQSGDFSQQATATHCLTGNRQGQIDEKACSSTQHSYDDKTRDFIEYFGRASKAYFSEVHLRLGLPFWIGVVLLLALTIDLDSTPRLWWDEGWTMSVARNWVEEGHYGRFLYGKPVPRGLEAPFPVTGTIALSFRLFGVGIYQARLVSVAFTIAALFLLFELTRRFYNRSIALATLVVLVLLTGNDEINPLIVGRQVLAEIPALFFLLAACFCFILSEKRSFLFMLAAICFWSLAIFTKLQVQPFWAASLLVPIAILLIQRTWKLAGFLAAGFGVSVMLLFLFQHLSLQTAPVSTVSGLTQVIALALNRHSRLTVLAETLEFGMPTLFGLSWALWTFLSGDKKLQNHTEVVRLSLLVFAGSWFAWYLFLSLGWPRYLFPAAFIASPFVAAMLYDWTNKFSLAYTIERSAALLKTLHLNRVSLPAFAAVVLVAMSLGRTLTVLYGAYVIDADSSVKDVVNFLNTKTPPNALIETYESELFCFLKRRYHYPPDQVHVELIRKNSFGESVAINYDPLAADPDYLVLGRQNRFWDFYDPYLNSGKFRLLQKYGIYEIFERVR
jgi:4-amino-4-deoxy-L-arabinose transferase-like glycosyltransferase